MRVCFRIARSRVAIASLGLGISLALAPQGFAQSGYPQDPARFGDNTRNGAVIGGLAGAVMGGVVGHNHKDQTAEGALIGGAVGAVAGGLIGNQKDRMERQRRAYEQQRQQYYQQQAYQYPHGYVGQPTIVYGAPQVRNRSMPQPIPVPPKQPVTIEDVTTMVRSGVSDTVIVAQLQSNGIAMRPDVNEVIRLSQEGVSDYVINAMQTVNVSPLPPGYIPSQPIQPSQRNGYSANSYRTIPSQPNFVPSSSQLRSSNGTPRMTPPPLLERRGF